MPAARGTSFRQVNFQRGARAYDQSAVPEQVHHAPRPAATPPCEAHHTQEET